VYFSVYIRKTHPAQIKALDFQVPKSGRVFKRNQTKTKAKQREGRNAKVKNGWFNDQCPFTMWNFQSRSVETEWTDYPWNDEFPPRLCKHNGTKSGKNESGHL